MRKYGPPPLSSPLVAMAASDSVVRKVAQQQIPTIPRVRITPASPTIQLRRMKRMMPMMFWQHGRNTPANVPSSCFSPPAAAASRWWNFWSHGSSEMLSNRIESARGRA